MDGAATTIGGMEFGKVTVKFVEDEGGNYVLITIRNNEVVASAGIMK